MEIKVTFRFDASDSLLACVDNFRKAMEAMAASGGLTGLPVSKEVGIVKAVATEEGVTVNKKERIWPPVEDAAGKPLEAATSGAEGEGGATGQPAGEAPPEATETALVPTVSDMRAAVTRLRERIEGKDWEDKTSEGYKLYHKKVTAAVKGIVAFCGADKIPGIPEENRAAFIQRVDDLTLIDGEVMPNVPF